MTASFDLTLDTQAPANPSLLINGGAAVTGDPMVWVDLSTSDYLTGANDVLAMKIWGDVDLVADPSFTPQEADATWIAFDERVPVLLSAGSGRKYLYARFRDDVGNESLPFSDFIDLNIDIPTVSITTAADRDRISKVNPFHTTTFVWEANVPFLAYEVRVVPSHGSPRQAGVVLGTSGGSLGVSGDTRIEALTPVTTTITGGDLEAASPGDTVKVVKVFVQGVEGTWSA